jgi:hypothetical protein
MRTTN